jgi:hypothetical protein
MNHNDEFDQVLDEALAEYRDAAPLTGMEHRVLQRVRIEANRRRKIWLKWSAFSACAAMLAIMMWLGLRDRARHELVLTQLATARQERPSIEAQPKNANTRAGNEGPSPKRNTAANAAHQRSARTAEKAWAVTAHVPVCPQFPSPTPLNPEERALLALAQTHPDALSHLSDKPDNQEIAISPINIEPLIGETSGKQGEN